MTGKRRLRNCIIIAACVLLLGTNTVLADTSYVGETVTFTTNFGGATMTGSSNAVSDKKNGEDQKQQEYSSTTDITTQVVESLDELIKNKQKSTSTYDDEDSNTTTVVTSTKIKKEDLWELLNVDSLEDIEYTSNEYEKGTDGYQKDKTDAEIKYKKTEEESKNTNKETISEIQERNTKNQEDDEDKTKSDYEEFSEIVSEAEEQNQQDADPTKPGSTASNNDKNAKEIYDKNKQKSKDKNDEIISGLEQQTPHPEAPGWEIETRPDYTNDDLPQHTITGSAGEMESVTLTTHIPGTYNGKDFFYLGQDKSVTDAYVGYKGKVVSQEEAKQILASGEVSLKGLTMADVLNPSVNKPELGYDWLDSVLSMKLGQTVAENTVNNNAFGLLVFDAMDTNIPGLKDAQTILHTFDGAQIAMIATTDDNRAIFDTGFRVAIMPDRETGKITLTPFQDQILYNVNNAMGADPVGFVLNGSVNIMKTIESFDKEKGYSAFGAAWNSIKSIFGARDENSPTLGEYIEEFKEWGNTPKEYDPGWRPGYDTSVTVPWIKPGTGGYVIDGGLFDDLGISEDAIIGRDEDGNLIIDPELVPPQLHEYIVDPDTQGDGRQTDTQNDGTQPPEDTSGQTYIEIAKDAEEEYNNNRDEHEDEYNNTVDNAQTEYDNSVTDLENTTNEKKTELETEYQEAIDSASTEGEKERLREELESKIQEINEDKEKKLSELEEELNTKKQEAEAEFRRRIEEDLQEFIETKTRIVTKKNVETLNDDEVEIVKMVDYKLVKTKRDDKSIEVPIPYDGQVGNDAGTNSGYYRWDIEYQNVPGSPYDKMTIGKSSGVTPSTANYMDVTFNEPGTYVIKAYRKQVDVKADAYEYEKEERYYIKDSDGTLRPIATKKANGKLGKNGKNMAFYKYTYSDPVDTVCDTWTHTVVAPGSNVQFPATSIDSETLRIR